MFVQTKKILSMLIICTLPIGVLAAPTWKKVNFSTSASTTEAPTYNCVTLITSSKSLTSGALASLPASVEVSYILVGAGGGGGNTTAGINGSIQGGTFTAASSGTSFSAYVGGGGGGATGTRDNGGSGGAGYFGGGGGGVDNDDEGGGGGGGSTAILWGGVLIDSADGGKGGDHHAGVTGGEGGTGIAGGAIGITVHGGATEGTQFNGGDGAYEFSTRRAFGAIESSGGAITDAGSGSGGGYGAGGGSNTYAGGSNGDECLSSVKIGKCPTVGVSSLDSGSEYTIYPNPAKDELIINASFKNQTSGSLALFDIMGHALYQYEFDENILDHQIDLGSLLPGTYLLEIKTDRESYVEKVMILE